MTNPSPPPFTHEENPMPVKLPDEHTEQDAARRREQVAAIGAKVMHALGLPDGLQRVQVRPLWHGRFRVNIFVGPDAASVRLVHSFFLAVDDNGTLLWSVPEITKQY